MRENIKSLLVLIIIALCIGLLFTSVTAAQVERAPRVNIKGYNGDDFIGQAGILYPFSNKDDSLYFSDLRYWLGEEDVEEWNLGLGYRKKIETAENHIAGLYFYRDRREEYDHYWDMWTIGGEILTDKWDFRLNAYLADDDKILAPGAAAGGSYLDVDQNQDLVLVIGNEVYYTAMDGFDIGLGHRFTEAEGFFQNIGVYAELFRFTADDVQTLRGKRLRIDKKFGNPKKTTWKLGASWRDDNIRGSETEALFEVSIPFGKGAAVVEDEELLKSEIIEARMTEQPQRDLDIIIGESVSENAAAGEVIPIENLYDEEDSVKVWYVTQNGSDKMLGTKADPLSLEYINSSYSIKSNDINTSNGISPRNGDIIVLVGNIDLAENQYLYLNPNQQLVSSYNGSGAAVVDNPLNDEKLKFYPDVETAVLTGNVEGEGLVMPAEGSIISGIHFVNQASDDARFIYIEEEYGNLNINNNLFELGENNSPSNIYGIYLNSSSDPEGVIDIYANNFDLKTTDADYLSAVELYSIYDTEVNIFKNTINIENNSAVDSYNLNGINIGTINRVELNINDNNINIINNGSLENNNLQPLKVYYPIKIINLGFATDSIIKTKNNNLNLIDKGSDSLVQALYSNELDNTDLEIENNNIDIVIAGNSTAYGIDIRNLSNASSFNLQNNNFTLEAGPESDIYGVLLNNNNAINEENDVKIINNTFEGISQPEFQGLADSRILGIYINDFSSEPVVSDNVFTNIDYGISNIYISTLGQSVQITRNQDLIDKYKNDVNNQFSDILDDQRVIIGEIEE
jgi:hypothetical protein